MANSFPLGQSAGNQGQNLLGKSDDNTTGQSEETVGSLAGVVGFEGEADLHHTEAQQDHTNGPDEAKNEIAEVVDNGQRIAGGKAVVVQQHSRNTKAE